jgi:hypothetical protein
MSTVNIPALPAAPIAASTARIDLIAAGRSLHWIKVKNRTHHALEHVRHPKSK